MAIYDFFLSRNNGPTVANYVGHAGRLFYDSAERILRISDGTTAGGEVFNGLITVANTEPTVNFQGQVWLNPTDSALTVYHDGNFISTINVATSTILGGVKLGPGVTTNGDGQIIIDSEGLDFSFGDLASTTGTYDDSTSYAVLSTINTNEDLYLVSNGTGSIDIIGEFNVYKTDGDIAGAIAIDPIFTVKADGQIRMLVPGADSNEGALNIIGGLDGVFQNPLNSGVMLHITGIAGSPGVPSRVYNDAQNAFAAFVGRRYNNTAASPSAVLANEEIMRLSGTAHNGTEIPGTANQRIVYVARGNQTISNQGGAIELWATPLNSITLAKVATVDSTGIILESGKALTGNVTGNASTATSAATLTTARNINGVSFNGSADITVTANTTNALTISTGLSGTSFNGSSAVTIALATGYGDTQNPYASKTANNFLAAPNGSNGAPTFRAIVAADIPTLNQNTTGSAATLTTARNINGVSFNGSADITVTAAAGTLTGNTLASGVTASSLTSVGTLGSLTVTNLVTAKNYSGQVRNLGIITAGAGTEITIDFATDHMVRFSYSTEPVQVAFTNYSAGKTVTLIAVNTNAANRQLEIGIAAANAQGASTLDVNGNTTAIVTYYCTGTLVGDVFASTVYVI
jgi:hypothetical protein